MVSQAGDAEICPGFPPPQQPSSLLHPGKRYFGYNDVVAASSSCKVKGRKTSMMEIQ